MKKKKHSLYVANNFVKVKKKKKSTFGKPQGRNIDQKGKCRLKRGEK